MSSNSSFRCSSTKPFVFAWPFSLASLSRSQQGGAVIYHPDHEGRGIGLADKLRAYELQDKEVLDTVDANLALGFAEDERDYSAVPSILANLGITSIILLTNNPAKREALEELGVAVAASVPIVVESAAESGCKSERYMITKAERMGHEL